MTASLHDLFGDRLTVYPDREAWLAARQPPGAYALGATAVRAILGHGYDGEGPWTVWASHHAPHLLPERRDDGVLSRGRRLEPVVRDGYAERTGYHVEAPLCLLRHADPIYSWACYSPDGFVLDTPDGTGGLECKTMAFWDDWGEDGIECYPGYPLPVPAPIGCQVYWQLLVSGLPWCDVAAMRTTPYGLEDRAVRLWADPAFQADLLAQVGAWRKRHLVGGEEPPHDGSAVNRRWLAGRYPEGREPRIATPTESAAIQEYARLGREIKRSEAERAILAAQLLASAGDAKALLLGGGKARCAIIRAKGRRSIAVSAIERHSTLYHQLDERGLVKTSDPTTSLRVYGLGDDEE